MCKLLIFTFLLLAIAFLLLYVKHPKVKNAVDKMIPQKNSSHSLPRSKRSLDLNCSKLGNLNVDEMEGFQLLQSLFTSKEKRNLFKGIPQNAAFANLISLVNHRIRFISTINGNPAISFSLNIPSFECLKSSTFSSFFNNLETLHPQLFHRGINTVRVINIPVQHYRYLDDFVKNIAGFLLQLDPNFVSTLGNLSFNKSICAFTTRCKVYIKYSRVELYSATFTFAPLKDETNRLLPRPESRQIKFNSLGMVFVRFNELKDLYISHFNETDNQLGKTYEESYNRIVARIDSFLRERIIRLDDNFVYSLIIPNGENSQVLNKSLVVGKDWEMIETFNVYNLPTSELRSIEFSMFALMRTAVLNNESRENVTEFVKSSFAVKIPHLQNPYLFAKNTDYRKRRAVEYPLPSLTKENGRYSEKFNYVTNNDVKEEKGLRDDFVEALMEMNQLMKGTCQC